MNYNLVYKSEWVLSHIITPERVIDEYYSYFSNESKFRFTRTDKNITYIVDVTILKEYTDNSNTSFEYTVKDNRGNLVGSVSVSGGLYEIE